jgi:transposase
LKEEGMGFKKWGKEISFADLAVSKSFEHNRSLQMMMRIDKVVKWRDVEALLMEHYEIGTSKEGGDAYPPLMLLKALLLQKWFRIPSDPELENQINDRISFKKFLGLPLDRPSPDHSTFSRFRSRLDEEAMRELNSLLFTMLFCQSSEVLFRPEEAVGGGFLAKGSKGLAVFLSRRTDQYLV